MEISGDLNSASSSNRSEFETRYTQYIKTLQENNNISNRLQNLDEMFAKTDRLGRAWYRLYIEGEEMSGRRELSPDVRFAYKCTAATIFEVWKFMQEVTRKELIAKKATSLPSVIKLDSHITIELSEKSQIKKDKIIQAFETSKHDINATLRRVLLHLKYWLKNYAKNVPSYVATEDNLLFGFEVATKRWNELNGQ